MSTAVDPQTYTMTVARAAELFGLGQSTIRLLIHQGKVPVRRHGRRVLVPYDALRAYVDALPDDLQPE
jgi:excisionase family DNA binding protein